jgi:hypothetical protein
MSDLLITKWPSHCLPKISDALTRVLWQLDEQTHLAAKQEIGDETWPLNFAYTCRVLLHAIDLRHGTDYFTSALKEGILKDC